jgi:hypothetical protein
MLIRPRFSFRAHLENDLMDSYYELFDVSSGNVVADDERESDAVNALIELVMKHGTDAIKTVALSRMERGHPALIAMQDDLVALIETRMTSLDRARPETA